MKNNQKRCEKTFGEPHVHPLIAHRGGRYASVLGAVHHHRLAQSSQQRGQGTVIAGQLHVVLTFERVERMLQAAGHLPRVGEQQQALGHVVQPAHSVQQWQVGVAGGEALEHAELAVLGGLTHHLPTPGGGVGERVYT